MPKNQDTPPRAAAADPLTPGQRLHFMGIGGIGMSALAGLARARGLLVDGCDRQESEQARAVAASGIAVVPGHDAAHAEGADWLVYSSAIPAGHPERAAARRVLRRGELLARFMEAASPNIGIAGTHGKTTTTWILAHLLLAAGRDPSVFLGGVAAGLEGGNWRAGRGPFVAELDESDATFLEPRLDFALVNNVDSDHLAHYGDDAGLRAAFRTFAARAAHGGVLFVNRDDEGARPLLAGPGRRVAFSTRGAASRVDLYAEELAVDGGGRRFRMVRAGRLAGEYYLPLPGRHNFSNAVAALALAMELGLAPERLAPALATLAGVGRRLERCGAIAGAVVYNDYAHHPAEIRAGLAALRERHAGPLAVVFQPHLYSRTRDHAAGFGAALALADEVLLVDIYPAREAPIPGVTAELVAASVRGAGGRADGPVPLDEVAEWVRARATAAGAIILMGAGDIGTKVPAELFGAP